MSEGPTAAGAVRRVGSGTTRLVRAWKALPNESRLAVYASGALFLTLFLPWYQVTLIAPARAARLQSASATITGWGAFSFVEAAVLIVVIGVLTLLFQRAEGRAFHLPGGDGGVILAAGLWTCLLIVWRIFDKQGATTNGPSATTSGIEWGIFIALGAAAFLAYAGSRIRAAHRPEPPLPGEDTAPAGSSAAARTTAGEAAATAHEARTAAGADAATPTAGEAAPRKPRSAPPSDRTPVPPRRRPRTAPPVSTAPPPYIGPPAGTDRSSHPRRSVETSLDRNASASPARNANTSPARNANTRPARNANTRPARNANTSPARNANTSPARNANTSPARNANTSPARNANTSPARNANTSPARTAAASPDRSPGATPIPEAASQPAPDRRGRRPSAAELFERVVPDDPPAMPFGRAKPADVDATLRMTSRRPPEDSPEPTASGDAPTMPLGIDDETLPLDRHR